MVLYCMASFGAAFEGCTSGIWSLPCCGRKLFMPGARTSLPQMGSAGASYFHMQVADAVGQMQVSLVHTGIYGTGYPTR